MLRRQKHDDASALPDSPLLALAPDTVAGSCKLLPHSGAPRGRYSPVLLFRLEAHV